MQRPTGMTIFAVLSFAVALANLANGLVLISGGSFLPRLLFWVVVVFSMLAGWGSHALGALALALPVPLNLYFGIYLLMTLLYAAIGMGFLGMRNWARWLIIVLASFELATTAVGYTSLRFLLFRQSMIGVAIDIAVLIYLFRPKVKEIFGASAV